MTARHHYCTAPPPHRDSNSEPHATPTACVVCGPRSQMGETRRVSHVSVASLRLRYSATGRQTAAPEPYAHVRSRRPRADWRGAFAPRPHAPGRKRESARRRREPRLCAKSCRKQAMPTGSGQRLAVRTGADRDSRSAPRARRCRCARRGPRPARGGRRREPRRPPRCHLESPSLFLAGCRNAAERRASRRVRRSMGADSCASRRRAAARWSAVALAETGPVGGSARPGVFVAARRAGMCGCGRRRTAGSGTTVRRSQ